MQKKLTDEEIEKCIAAKVALVAMPDWSLTTHGESGFLEVHKEIEAMISHGTSDGKPWVEPQLTDKDALKRPWVVVRQNESKDWSKPRRLVFVNKEFIFPFYTETNSGGVAGWRFCRFATAEEIAAMSGIDG
jgi:hypothetical protein